MAKRIVLFVVTNLLVMLALTVVFLIVSQFFQLDGQGYFPLLVMCAIFGFGGSLISLAISKWMAKTMMGVQVIDPQSARSGVERELVRRVHLLAQKAGLPKMPEVGIYQSPEVNAFATGPSKSNSLVAVSTGLLQRMDSAAVEGVLGHEVAHIANGDMVTMTLLQGVVNTFVMFFARILAWAVASAMSRDENEGPGFFVQYMLVMVFQMLLMPLGYIVIAYFSRQREFRADAGGAKLAGRDKMLRGLQSLVTTTELVDNRDQQLAAFKISGRRSGIMALMSTHPPLEQRIEALKTAPAL